MRSHAGEKTYKCSQYGKAFSWNSFLGPHAWTHPGEELCLSVASVDRSSALPRALLYPRGCTLGRSCVNAVTVGRPPSGAVTRQRVREYTRERNAASAAAAAKPLAESSFWRRTGEPVLGRSPTHSVTAEKPSVRALRQLPTRGYMQEGRCSSVGSFPVIHHVGNTWGCTLKTSLGVEAEKGSSIPQESNCE